MSLTLRKIRNAVAQQLDLNPEAVAQRRDYRHTRARHLTLLLTRDLTNASYPQMGRLLRMDQSTVRSAVVGTRAKLASDEGLQSAALEVLRKLAEVSA